MIEENELSDREIEIIRLVATGASNKEIANTLFISPNTVKVHLRNIFSKLGVLSRTEATMTAIRLGLVDSPGNQATNSVEISSNIDGSWPVQEQDILHPVINKRYLFFAIALGIIVLVLMGYLLNRVLTESNQQAISAAEIEELSSKRWTSIQNMPTGLSAMGYGRYENQFLIFGGAMIEGNSDSLWIYDIDNDIWKEGSKIPLALKEFQMAMVGEKIFLPGGVDNSNITRSELWIYNPREDSWISGAEVPHPISAYSLVPFEGKLFLFGGFDGQDYLDTVFVYDPVLDEWTLSGHMPEAKAFSSAVVLGGQIHVMGGKNDNDILVNHNIYFPQRELLGENAWEKAAELPQGRFGMNSIVLADMIYMVGGNDLNGESLPLIQYLPPKDSWVEIDNPPIKIGFSPAVLPYETRLYVFGGLGLDGFSDQSLVYQAVYTILVPVVR